MSLHDDDDENRDSDDDTNDTVVTATPEPAPAPRQARKVKATTPGAPDPRTIIADIRSEEENLRQRKQDAARDLRERARELHNQADEILRKADEEMNNLRNQARGLAMDADEIDPPEDGPSLPPQRRAVRKVTLRVGAGGVTEVPVDESHRRPRKPKTTLVASPDGTLRPAPKPRRPRKPKADATTRPKRGRKPAHDSSEAAVRREKRAKKPPAEPSGRPRGGAVEPTPAAVLKIVKASGDEGINKAGICKAGEFDNSKLGVLLQGMVRDEKLSKEGRGAGCEYFIAGA